MLEAASTSDASMIREILENPPEINYLETNEILNTLLDKTLFSQYPGSSQEIADSVLAALSMPSQK